MKYDADLLKELKNDPILHLYGWEGPSATHGYFIEPEKHLDLEAMKRHKISLGRRPTGGGIVFHIWDYAFSFLMPSSHPLFSETPIENYRFVNGVVLQVMQEILNIQDSIDLIADSFPVRGEDCQNFCMARPTQYDVVYKGYKIAGAAQRKTKNGYLHQGTISLSLPDETILREVLLSKEEVMAAMKTYSFAPFGSNCDSMTLDDVRREVGRGLGEALGKRLK